ncbi:Nif3-like dinuclear metal center hexameric protein [Acidimicrobiaceae bacterium]|nr:Nif3-like dinuclear metal center hexameric protein [Acidimicrobiaceae bacterium]
MKLFELLDNVNKIVPLKYAFEDDSVGITIGDKESNVNNIVIGHELDDYLLEYCSDNNVDTVITYHPPPFKKIIEEDDSENFLPDSITTSFIDSSINVITIHTAQDVCKDGNADTLVDLFNIKNPKVFAQTVGKYGAGRYGTIDMVSPLELQKLIENKLNTKIIRTNEYFENMAEIGQIAVLPGSGTQFMEEILDITQVFITGDISHRYLLKADEEKMGLIQIGHISSEIPGMRKFVEKFNKFVELEINYVYKDFYE